MRSSWRDPDDITPNARRTARAIAGFRAGCALRRMMHHHAGRSSIIEEHVIAADLLRLQVDAVLIGFFPGRRELMPVSAIMYGPRTGPSIAALRSVRAWKPLQQALALFTEAERRLLSWVVLENRSVASWCAALREQGLSASPNRGMQTLVETLDRLVLHYDVTDDWRVGL